ncbi:MAG: tail fiber domain-containing protein [Rhodothermales bacterium]|nr:tail fiber domain-containing protein [Rhodothermales bacterium]
MTLANPVNPFPAGLFDGDIWLDFTIAGETLVPRRKLNTSAYSFKSADAEALGGLPAAALDQSGGVATNAGDIAVVAGEVSANESRIATLEATDITMIAANGGLTGGGSSGTVGLSIATNGVTAAMLQADSVTSSEIADFQITNVDLANNSVSSANIVNGQVSTSDIADGTIQGVDIRSTTSMVVGGMTVNGPLVNTFGSGGDSIINLLGFANFVVQNAGVDVFRVLSSGTINLGGNMVWRDNNASAGDTLATLTDGGGNDGVFRVFENSLVSIELDGNVGSAFNLQNRNRSFRIATVDNTYGFYVDAFENNVGVGTSALDRNFHVRHDQFTGIGGFGGIEIENGTNNAQWTLYTSQSSSNLALYFGGLLRGEFNNATGSYLALSDERLKKDIEPIGSSLAGIMQLNPTRYRFKDQGSDEVPSAGFLAQEVMAVFPEAVEVQPDDTNGAGLPDIHLMDYSALIPHLVRGMQEQQSTIERLEKRIAELEAR